MANAISKEPRGHARRLQFVGCLERTLLSLSPLTTAGSSSPKSTAHASPTTTKRKKLFCLSAA
jgi:hypothetical protein